MTGNGNYIFGSDGAPLPGQSECAYSGQNDEFRLFPNEDWPRTQSWGQEIRGAAPVVGGHVGVPGFACNPTGGPG